MRELQEMLNQLRLEDLKGESCYQMAEAIGMEAFRKLVLAFGGTDPYIPKAESLILPVRNILINREYDGTNEFQLSRKWGVSERYIREIAKEKVKEIRERPIDGQVRFF